MSVYDYCIFLGALTAFNTILSLKFLSRDLLDKRSRVYRSGMRSVILGPAVDLINIYGSELRLKGMKRVAQIAVRLSAPVAFASFTYAGYLFDSFNLY